MYTSQTFFTMFHDDDVHAEVHAIVYCTGDVTHVILGLQVRLHSQRCYGHRLLFTDWTLRNGQRIIVHLIEFKPSCLAMPSYNDPTAYHAEYGPHGSRRP